MGNKVVARFMDGRMEKGLVFHFDPDKKHCSLKDPDKPYEEGKRYPQEELKALFFVKDFAGNKDYKSDVTESKLVREKKVGKKVAIKFKDGETMYLLAYDLDRFEKGFYAFPIDEKSNNDRLFVFRHAIEAIRDVEEGEN